MKKNMFFTKKYFFKWSFVFVLTLLVVGTCWTYAAMKDTDIVANNFKIGNIQTDIQETFEPPTIFEADTPYVKEVSVKNTGDVPIFVRVLAHPVITSQKSDGSLVLLPSSVEGTHPTLTINYNLVDWIDGKDGFFYYKKKINAGETSSLLFSKVQLNSANLTEDYTNSKLSFEIKAEAINTSMYAYRDAWWNGLIGNSEVDDLLKVEVSK